MNSVQESKPVLHQERALISSVRSDSFDEAIEWGDCLFPVSAKLFVPAIWGEDLLEILGDESRYEAEKVMNRLDPRVNRTLPVQITKVHNVWGPLADPIGGASTYILAMIVDIDFNKNAV